MRGVWRLVRWLLWLIWAIARPAFRFVSAVLLLAAVIVLTADVTRWQVGEEDPMFLSLGHHIKSAAPATFEGTGRMIGQTLHPLIWDPVLLGFFAIPAWIIFAGLAVLFAYASREPKRINIFVN